MRLINVKQKAPKYTTPQPNKATYSLTGGTGYMFLLASSFCGVAAVGLSKSRKSNGLSLRVRTRGGVFRDKGSNGVVWIRSRSAGLEKDPSSLWPVKLFIYRQQMTFCHLNITKLPNQLFIEVYGVGSLYSMYGEAGQIYSPPSKKTLLPILTFFWKYLPKSLSP